MAVYMFTIHGTGETHHDHILKQQCRTFEVSTYQVYLDPYQLPTLKLSVTSLDTPHGSP
jgi:hypothetical protein